MARARADRSAKPPEAELCLLVPEAPVGSDWIHETKYDGYRILARKDGTSCELWSRNGNDWSKKYASVAEALREVDAKSFTLDGEVVRLDESGRSRFHLLQRVEMDRAVKDLQYFVFDLLELNGRDLRERPLLERKKLLAGFLKKLPKAARRTIFESEYVVGHGAEVFKAACQAGLEGIVSKPAESLYRPGHRDDWLKVKCLLRQEFVLAGWTDPQGAREDFGSLLLGYYEKGKLRYAGRVGTGFDRDSLSEISQLLLKHAQDKSPFDEPLPPELRRLAPHWVKPRLVGEVAFTEWTPDGRLRHPAFEGLRLDKKAQDVGRERPTEIKEVTVKKKVDPEMTFEKVQISHPEKLLYPKDKITKGEVAAYYQKVAPLMLPFLAGRPVTLRRCPGGIEKACFFQRHPVHTLGPGLREVKARGEKEPYVAIESAEGLLRLVQSDVLEFHVWGSTADRPDQAEQITFDFDPDAVVPVSELIRGVKMLRKRLEALGFTAFLKSSGGKGLHVVLPLSPSVDWTLAKAFAREMAESLEREEPELFLSKASLSARKERSLSITFETPSAPRALRPTLCGRDRGPPWPPLCRGRRSRACRKPAPRPSS